MSERTPKIIRPDIIRRDEHGIPVAIVEVKYAIKPSDRDFFLRQLTDYMRAVGSVRYSILVDPADIEVFEGAPVERHSWKLRTSDIFKRYDAKYSDRRNVDEGYLSTLVNAWLDDLSFHAAKRKLPEVSELPPGFIDVLRAA